MKVRSIVTSLSAFATVNGLAVRHDTHNVPTVQIKNGTLSGVSSSEYAQDFFLGVPFAQPPVGNLRFQLPQPINASWSEPKTADKYAPSCIGYGSDQWGYDISEDCLYLNVIRPSGYEGEALPVAFWIHGGGFFMGGGGDRRYNMSFIVENSVKIGKPIIGVTINYRLAGWGFLNSNEVMGRGLANLGLKDQRLALHWVQENIEAFGGDPKKVTIWGESAGAASVGYHITAYGGRDDGLFRGAIMQSGNPIAYGAMNGTNFYQPQYDYVVEAAGCTPALNKLQCLRELSFERLNEIFNGTTPLSWPPTVDGDFLKKYGSVQLEAGEFVKVPIISGANSDEGASFGPPGVNTTEDFRALLSAYPTSFQDEILAAYPDDLSVNILQNLGNNRPPAYPYGLQFRRSASFFGDFAFIAQRRQTCSTWAAHTIPAYCYRFNTIPAGLPPIAGVAHFQEVAFVFYNLNGEGYGPPISTKPFEGKGESFSELARVMSNSWASFVADLDPNGWGDRGDVEDWPEYVLEDPKDMVWDANVTSFAESDTYRKEGMEAINRNHANLFMR